MKKIKIASFILVLLTLGSCKKYLDIVPDNVATLEYAFRMRSVAEKYLFTCYSFMPNLGGMQENPALFSADELWMAPHYNWEVRRIGLGEQNVNSPLFNYWDGSANAEGLWVAISQCNVFLENIVTVPDMRDDEKLRWSAEVKFLKAFYMFSLLRNYGPIPIMKENIAITAPGDEMRVLRRPVDEVFDYIIQLIEEAELNLPNKVMDEHTEYGRITLPIALGYKAKILVYAASPLFNGNPDFAGFVNVDGTHLFSTAVNPEKWRKAADAAKEAIDLAHSLGYKLYEFEKTVTTQNLAPAILAEMNIRGTLTERWNEELLWVNPNSTTAGFQAWLQPRALNASQISSSTPNGSIGVPMKIAALFYTKNGVPIEEDLSWNYNTRFNLRTATANEKYYIKQGQQTAEFNFDREPRFYGSLGFDRGIWYGHGKYDGNTANWLELKVGEYGGKREAGYHSTTGYYAKKLVNYTNTSPTANVYTAVDYPWVMLRLGDLYLLYAEALNEIDGPSAEVYTYLDKIRTKASLPGVVEAWSQSSRNPLKPTTQAGLREIIQRERAIEMAFEGERFYDLRRWKTAPNELNKPITGWDVDQENVSNFYRQKTLFNQTFSFKDYFWPIKESSLIVNKNLVQNPGW